MDTRTWTRRRFLHTAGFAGLAPLAIPRIAHRCRRLVARFRPCARGEPGAPGLA